MKGKVLIVAKTGGIKVDAAGDKWLNPLNESIKSNVRSIAKGDIVEFEEKEGKLLSIKKADSDVKKDVDWDSKERRMIRMNVLARSVELFIAGKVTNIPETASKFEKFVYDGKV